MASMISYAPYLVGTERKSDPTGATPSERRISRQIDTLQRISRAERDKRYGAHWCDEMRDFFEMNYQSSSSAPSYRPKVNLPELQYLLMSESTDLTNDTPKCYISVNGRRDEQREKAFQSAWKQGLVNNRVFDAVLWSQFSNPSWLQVGYSPDARNGKGMPWVRAIDPDALDPDPHAKDDREWSFVVHDRWYYVDEIRRMFSDQGYRIPLPPPPESYEPEESQGSHFDLTMEVPEGPLRVDAPEGFEGQNRGSRKRVRYVWVKDYARDVVREIAGEKTAEGFELAFKPTYKWKYPGGRFIVECDGVNLADGPNWVPKLPEDDFGTFPFLGVWSLPHLSSIFGPPPVRYGRGAQDIAEKMYTQLVENMIRTNNAQYWIPRDSNIDVDAFGGLPGEVQVYDGEKAPSMNWANPIPQHMTQIPEILLQKCARYVGWTPERQGQAGSGNISPELFDAAVFQSQSILRMKARLLAESYQRLVSMMFYMMARMKLSEDTMRPARGQQQKPCIWSPIPGSAECDIELDEVFLRAVSSTMMKSLVMALAKTGMLPAKFIFETMEIPHADELAEESTRQMELAALAKLKKPR
jgi:hypothetical protein